MGVFLLLRTTNIKPNLLRRWHDTNRQQNIPINALLARGDNECDIRFTGNIWHLQNNTPNRTDSLFPGVFQNN